ncbi:GINS complex protein [Zea mays]|uniref:GINS complex protein n=1 Tax=Zea mays TaxID=4577 RepID=A0A1D6IXQ2_MAIZE|nr:GINS complex protein [Zea mays]
MRGYYDIDDILMEDEPISVVFQVTANGVGLLDPGAENNCVEKGAKVDLPFWLAHGLLSLEQAVSINPPPCFTQKYVFSVSVMALLLHRNSWSNIKA